MQYLLTEGSQIQSSDKIFKEHKWLLAGTLYPYGQASYERLTCYNVLMIMCTKRPVMETRSGLFAFSSVSPFVHLYPLLEILKKNRTKSSENTPLSWNWSMKMWWSILTTAGMSLIWKWSEWLVGIICRSTIQVKPFVKPLAFSCSMFLDVFYVNFNARILIYYSQSQVFCNVMRFLQNQPDALLSQEEL